MKNDLQLDARWVFLFIRTHADRELGQVAEHCLFISLTIQVFVPFLIGARNPASNDVKKREWKL